MLSWWLILILLVYFFVCLLLIFIILIQSGKGGGLSSLAQSTGGIGDQLGATGAEKTLNKITTGIAVSFMLLAIFLSLATSLRSSSDSAIKRLGMPPAPAPSGPIAPPLGPPGANETLPLPATAPSAPGATIDTNEMPVEPIPQPASEPDSSGPVNIPGVPAIPSEPPPNP